MPFRPPGPGAKRAFVVPTGGGRWQVCERGGCQPRWSHNGEELFYVEAETLVAVEVSTSSGLRVGQANRLFHGPSLTGRTWDYDVSADGRFVTVEDVVPDTDAPRKPAIRITKTGTKSSAARTGLSPPKRTT